MDLNQIDMRIVFLMGDPRALCPTVSAVTD